MADVDIATAHLYERQAEWRPSPSGSVGDSPNWLFCGGGAEVRVTERARQAAFAAAAPAAADAADAAHDARLAGRIAAVASDVAAMVLRLRRAAGMPPAAAAPFGGGRRDAPGAREQP